MGTDESWLTRALRERGVSRRRFLEFCGVVAASVSLPRSAAAEIAEAVEKKPKPTLVWLEYQDCAGNTESFLRAGQPTVAEILLDVVSVDYHETIMAAAGHKAEEALQSTIHAHEGAFIAVVEGSIPTADGGVYCTVGGRAAEDLVKEVCGKAAATIAVGTCATYGGLPAAAPNPTGAQSVAEVVPDVKNLVNMPACPVNAENLTALLVYYLTYDRWPPLDRLRRPRFAYGKNIHDNCERRAHYDAGQYAEAWGDEGHRRGYCLYKLGCKGPATWQNCPVIRWNDGTNWPIGCGHPCIGCAEPNFWDRMTPFYQHLPDVEAAGMATHIDTIGMWGTAGVAAAFGGHAVVRFARTKMAQRIEEQKRREQAEQAASGEAPPPTGEEGGAS
ncbi:MAG: hydrogenase small subunit [Myxococcota bacterium]